MYLFAIYNPQQGLANAYFGVNFKFQCVIVIYD
jgi:hypothetical protein